MGTGFERHAQERTVGGREERTKMSTADIAELLDTNKAVPLGSEEGDRQRITHWLFYSSKDKQCFVAVRDETDQQIITILPIDYHRRWKISFEAQEKAHALADPDYDPKRAERNLTRSKVDELKEKIFSHKEKNGPKIIFSITSTRGIIKLFSIPGERYSNTEAALADPDVIQLMNILLTKELEHMEGQPKGVYVQENKRGRKKEVDKSLWEK